MNISIFYRMLMVISFGLFSSALSWFLSEPPISEPTKQYQEYYDSLPNNGLISEDEYKQLKDKERQYIEESTTKEFFQGYVGHFLIWKSIIVIIVSFCWAFIAFKLKMRGQYLILSLIGILGTGAFFINIFESLWYAVVFLSSSMLAKKRVKYHNHLLS